MEPISIEEYISLLAQGLAPGYVTFLNQMNLTDCRKEAHFLINEKGHSLIQSHDPILSCLVLNFTRQISLALQSKQELEVEMACLKAQHANVLGELQTVGKKAVQYLHDLHSAESDLCSYREELFKLKSGCFKLPQPLSSVNLLSQACPSPASLTSSLHHKVGEGGSHLDSGFSDPCSTACSDRDSPVSSEHSAADPFSCNGSSTSSLEREKGDSIPTLVHLRKGEIVGPIQDCTFRAYPSRGEAGESSREHGRGESASLSGHTKRNANAPSFPSKTERTGDSSVQYTDSDKSASAHHRENNDCLIAPPSKENRGRRAQHETISHSDMSSVSPSPNRQTAVPSHGLRLEELESMAKDIQQFNPKDSEFNVQSYLREIDHCLSDLPRATDREKVKLIWKTSTTEIRRFMEQLPSKVRSSYPDLCEALVAEYLPRFDQATAMIKSVEVKHGRTERPKDFYQRLKYAFFQGRSGPGLVEDQAFKSLFVHNLHPCVRTHVSLFSRGQHSALELRNEAQMVWDTLRIVPRNGGLETAKPVVPTKPAGTSQAASFQNNGSKQQPRPNFPVKRHRGRFSYSDSSRNWREDRPGRPKLESHQHDSDREDTTSEESFFSSSEDN